MAQQSERRIFFDNNDLLERILFLYGHTDDSFYVSGTMYNSMEFMLERHLKQLGYDLVLFYNGVQRLYCFSQAMAEKRDELFREQRDAEDARSSQVMQELNDLLGERDDEPARDARHQSAPLRLQIDDLQIATFADQVMRREDVRSAIVFSDGWDLLNNTDREAMRTLSTYFRSWYHLGAGNRNLAIVCFGTLTQAHLDEYVKNNVGWSFLRDRMIQGTGFASAVKYISIPQADELEGRLRMEEDYRRLPQSKREAALIGAQRKLHELGNSLKGLDVFLKNAPGAVNALVDTSSDDDALNTLKTTRGWEAVAETVERIAKSVDLVGAPEPPAPCEGVVSRMTEMPPFAPAGVVVNMVLKGNPGTGKTTIARHLGKIYRKLGLLPSGHVVMAARDDLVGRYIGHTAANTRAKIEEAMGGILFIDEAYSLYRTGPGTSGNDFGIEAIDTLIEAMTRSVGSFAVVLAGYPEEMEHMLNANPGLRSRFGENIVTIADYEPDLLQEISLKYLAGKYGHTGITFDPALLHPGTSGNKPLDVFFKSWYSARNRKNFGNARDCCNLVDGLLAAVTNRGQKLITREDFPTDLREYFKEADLDLDSVLASLDDIVGQQEVKDKLLTIVRRLRLRNRQSAARPGNKERAIAPGHYAFCGNPGTGKSTIADKFAQVLGALRITGRFTPTRITGAMLLREMERGGVEGMRRVIEDARGGVLFIDEAHQLIRVPMALQLLLDPMLALRDELCVILAYYKDEEEEIFTAEPGLKSRLSGIFRFEDYDAGELAEIFKKKVAAAGYTLAEGAEAAALSWFAARLATDEKSDNGRYAERLLSIAEESMAERLNTEDDQLPDQALFEILPEDISGPAARESDGETPEDCNEPPEAPPRLGPEGEAGQ